MNLKTTLGLLVLAVAGGVLFWLGPNLAVMLTPAPARQASSAGETLRILQNELTPTRVTHVEVRHGDQALVLNREPDGSWSLPGKWPTRSAEVKQLIDRLTSLRSRFAPIATRPNSTLVDYGLDHPAVTIVMRAGDNDYRLSLGEPPLDATADDDVVSRFSRPTYLRLAVKKGDAFEDLPEVVRLAPGLLAALDRPVDYYQQRRLFPHQRLAKEGEAQEKTERLDAQGLAAKDTKAGVDYALKQAGKDWELTAPIRDRVDPDKIKSVLQAVPDVWAEQFVAHPKALEEYGLKEPEQIISVTVPGGVRTLLVGKVSRTKTRLAVRQPPPGMPMPPRPEPVIEEYRYAKLQDNDQVFEIKADRLKDILVSLGDLRDARLARYTADSATRVEVAPASGPKIVFVKDKDKNRWKIEEPFQADAEMSKVNEVLDKLSGYSARDKDIVDKADLKEYGLDKPAYTVSVTVEEDAKGEGDAKDRKKETKTFVFDVGKHDAKDKKLFLQVKGWERVNSVDDSLLSLVQRPALAYRGRRVLDFLSSDVDSIKVQRGKEAIALKRVDGNWKLTEPVAADADSAKPNQLASSLSNLDAAEFVADVVKPDELEAKYGLGKPALTVTLTYKDPMKKPQTLEIGQKRGDKDEYFAKLAGSDSVFALKKDIHDTLDQNSLAYLPLQLWQVAGEDVQELRIQKEGQPEYRVRKDMGGWKVAAPFEASAVSSQVQPMADEAAKLRAERYETHKATDPAALGLDKPFLRVTLVSRKEDAGKDDKKDEKPREHVLLVGKPTGKDGGPRFAKTGDGEAVFVVAENVVNALDHGALDLLDKQLVALDRDGIEKLRFESGNAKITLEKQKDEWRLSGSAADPFTADREAAATARNVWSSMEASRLAAYAPKDTDLAKFGLDKPASTVTVTLKKGGKEETHTLEIGKAPEDSPSERYARLDKGQAVAVLPVRVVRALSPNYLDYVNHSVLEFDPSAVKSVQRTRGEETLELTKGDDGWALVKPAGHKADARTVDDLLKQLGGRARRVAAYPATDLKPFDLDKPVSVVKFQVPGADGKTTEQVLKIGKTDGESGDRFVLANDSKAVHVLPAPVVGQLLAAPLAFRDRGQVRFVDADRAELQRGPRKALFAKVDGTWKLTQPITSEAEQTALDNLVNAVAELRASELVAEKPGDLKPYGLDKPELRWRFSDGDKEVLNILVGAREKGGVRHYAKLDKGDVVFLLDGPLTEKLLAEYRRRDVWSPSLDSAQAEELTVTRGGTTFGLEKVDGAWKVTGKPDVKVKADTVSDTLAAIAGLKAERFVEDKSANLKLYGLDPAEVVIEVRTPSGRRTLQIGRPEGESKRYYARVPDKDRTEVFVISEADAARILRELPAFTQPAKTDKAER